MEFQTIAHGQNRESDAKQFLAQTQIAFNHSALISIVHMERKSANLWMMRRVIPSIQTSTLAALLPMITIVSIHRKPNVKKRVIFDQEAKFVWAGRCSSEKSSAR